MNRRLTTDLGLLLLGLLLGILIGRWFMPDRYGLLTMMLLVGGGIVAGALLMRAALSLRWTRLSNAPRSVSPNPRAPAAPPEGASAAVPGSPASNYGWQMHVGESRVALRYDGEWWNRTRAGWRAGATPRAGQMPWLAIACLFGALCFALYGQFAFASDKIQAQGMYAYLFAIASFVVLVLLLDTTDQFPVVIDLPDRVTDSPLTGRVRPALILLAVLGGVVAAYVGATTAWNVPQTENIVLWLGACLLYVSAFVPWQRIVIAARARDWSGVRSLGQRLWQHRLEFIALCAILAVALVTRYWRLAWIPGIFGGDEGEMGSEAFRIVQGELKNPFITGWLSHGTLYFFVQSFFLRVLGPTIFGLRLSSVLAGTLSVLVAYLLVRRLFNVRLALVTAALLAVYNFHIHFSRVALNNIFDAVSAPLTLLLLYVGLESRRALYFALAGMVMGLGIYFYHGARLIPIIVAVFALYLLITERKLIVQNLVNFVWFVLGALAVVGPLLDFFYLHPNDFMARLTQRGIFQSGWFDNQVQGGRAAGEIMLEQFRRSFLAFNWVPDPTNWFGTGEPLLDPLSGMFFVFGSVYGIMQSRKKNYALMVIWLVLGIFFGSTLLENPPTSPSYVILTVPAIFLVALGLDKFIELASRVLRPLQHLRWQIAVVYVLLFAAWSLSFYFIDYTPRYSYGGEPNWVIRELVEYLQTRQDKYRVYFVAPPFIYLGIGSREFLMPSLNGQDVLEPISSVKDLKFVKPSHPALFVFVPARSQEFPIVQQTYPGGTVYKFKKPDGSPLFFIYQVNTP